MLRPGRATCGIGFLGRGISGFTEGFVYFSKRRVLNAVGQSKHSRYFGRDGIGNSWLDTGRIEFSTG
jgi:hypothetical protein